MKALSNRYGFQRVKTRLCGVIVETEDRVGISKNKIPSWCRVLSLKEAQKLLRREKVTSICVFVTQMTTNPPVL